MRLMDLASPTEWTGIVKQTGKERRGGVCLYVSEKFCDRANVTIKQRMSTPELELISVSLRPRYLPREFGRIFVTVVFAAVYDSTSAARAGKAIASAVRDLQLISADAPCFVVGDFNHCDLRKALPSFRQFVTCPTREKNTTDLCYGNVPCPFRQWASPIATPFILSLHTGLKYKLTPL